MAKLLHAAPLVSLFTIAACHAKVASNEPTPTTTTTAQASALEQAQNDTNAARELDTRYRVAITLFDSGRYDDAAAQFTWMLLHVPQDPSGDRLRHLLIQHIAWSLLGTYDTRKDPIKLDQGEAMLERYLDKHEQLRPDEAAERDDIYALLGEYAQRRDALPPTNANAHLRALIQQTRRHMEQSAPGKRKSNEDRMVRTIEVDTIKWADVDDPRVQRYLRDPRFTGPSLFEEPGEPYNPARVLVRGWVAKAHGADDEQSERPDRRAWTLLRAARPALERCYEAALGRGADVLERVELELRWDAGGLADVSVASNPSFDDQAARCVVEGVRAVGLDAAAKHDSSSAKLHLSFFTQPDRWPPNDSGPINQGAVPEDTSVMPPLPGSSAASQPTQRGR
jgi:hypothetical protein